MIGVSWNCRGLGNPQAVRLLCNLLRRKTLSFVFLMETKLYARERERVKNRVGFKNGIFVDCVNRVGGLCLLWRSDVTISINSY